MSDTKNQIEIIKHYLSIKTNYAILLSGDYGVGKTHFYKNILVPQIKEISTSEDDRKKFVPIHISLFGHKNLEDVQVAVFLEIHSILKNKNIKLGLGIMKSIIRGIALVKTTLLPIKDSEVDIDKFLKDIKPNPNDWIDYDQLVICFDDFDRKNTSLTDNEIFGFINSIVENDGSKIILIANEKKIDQDSYSSIKEKVVGVTILYQPILEDVFDQIIIEHYIGSNVYADFLKKHKTRIVQTIRINSNNFRNLLFFCEHFHQIHSELINLFILNDDFEFAKEEKFEAVLNFSLAIAFEYKQGLLNPTNIESITNIEKDFIGYETFSKALRVYGTPENADNLKPSYIETFKNKYFSDVKYYYFTSIFEYFIGKSPFDQQMLKTELERYFVSENSTLPEHQKILRKLGYWECVNLSSTEYKEATMKMLEYMDQGLYELTYYYIVFHNAIRFNNILKFNILNLKKRFKRGILKCIPYNTYVEHLNFHITVDSSFEFKNEIDDIVKFCIEANNKIKDKKEEETLQLLVKLFSHTYPEFRKKIMEDEIRYQPFWLKIGAKRLYKKLYEMSNSDIIELISYFRNRYRSNILTDLLVEKEFVEDLLSRLDPDSSRKRKERNFKNVSLDQMYNVLKECYRNFE